MPKYKTVKSSEMVHKFTSFLCSIAPVCLIITLELLSFMLFYLFDFFWIGYGLALASVFYWAVYAPARFRLPSAVIAGLCSDIMFMTPLGSQTLIFALVFKAVTKARKMIMPKSFKFAWLVFLLLSIIASLVLWSIISLVNQQLCAFLPVMVNAIIAWLCYPFVVLCCNNLLKILQRIHPYE
jgi:rod shape-determining protein MreD